MITKLIENPSQLKTILKAIFDKFQNTSTCPFEWAYEMFEELFYNVSVNYMNKEQEKRFLALTKEISEAGEQYDDFGGDEKIEEFDNRTFDLIEELDIPYPVTLSLGYTSGRDGDSDMQFMLRDANDMKMESPEKLVEEIQDFY